MMLRRQTIYPPIDLIHGTISIYGVVYLTWREALAAKKAGAREVWVDTFGRECDREYDEDDVPTWARA